MDTVSLNGDVITVRKLLEQGWDVNAVLDEEIGWTALCNAAKGGHSDVARVLLEHNARVDKAKNDGRTPLFMAAQVGHSDVVWVLLEHNAKSTKPGMERLASTFYCATQHYPKG